MFRLTTFYLIVVVLAGTVLAAMVVLAPTVRQEGEQHWLESEARARRDWLVAQERTWAWERLLEARAVAANPAVAWQAARAQGLEVDASPLELPPSEEALPQALSSAIAVLRRSQPLPPTHIATLDVRGQVLGAVPSELPVEAPGSLPEVSLALRRGIASDAAHVEGGRLFYTAAAPIVVEGSLVGAVWVAERVDDAALRRRLGHIEGDVGVALFHGADMLASTLPAGELASRVGNQLVRIGASPDQYLGDESGRAGVPVPVELSDGTALVLPGRLRARRRDATEPELGFLVVVQSTAQAAGLPEALAQRTGDGQLPIGVWNVAAVGLVALLLGLALAYVDRARDRRRLARATARSQPLQPPEPVAAQPSEVIAQRPREPVSPPPLLGEPRRGAEPVRESSQVVRYPAGSAREEEPWAHEPAAQPAPLGAGDEGVLLLTPEMAVGPATKPGFSTRSSAASDVIDTDDFSAEELEAALLADEDLAMAEPSPLTQPDEEEPRHDTEELVSGPTRVMDSAYDDLAEDMRYAEEALPGDTSELRPLTDDALVTDEELARLLRLDRADVPGAATSQPASAEPLALDDLPSDRIPTVKARVSEDDEAEPEILAGLGVAESRPAGAATTDVTVRREQPTERTGFSEEETPFGPAGRKPATRMPPPPVPADALNPTRTLIGAAFRISEEELREAERSIASARQAEKRPGEVSPPPQKPDESSTPGRGGIRYRPPTDIRLPERRVSPRTTLMGTKPAAIPPSDGPRSDSQISAPHPSPAQPPGDVGEDDEATAVTLNPLLGLAPRDTAESPERPSWPPRTSEDWSAVSRASGAFPPTEEPTGQRPRPPTADSAHRRVFMPELPTAPRGRSEGEPSDYQPSPDEPTRVSQASSVLSGVSRLDPAGPPRPQAQPREDEPGRFRDIYDRFIKTRIACGESIGTLTYERFEAKLRRNEEAVKRRFACKRVRFDVHIKNGRAALRATPIR